MKESASISHPTLSYSTHGISFSELSPDVLSVAPHTFPKISHPNVTNWIREKTAKFCYRDKAGAM